MAERGRGLGTETAGYFPDREKLGPAPQRRAQLIGEEHTSSVVLAGRPGARANLAVYSLQSPTVAGERHKLTVQSRSKLGSAESRRLRKQGLVPGVLYGREEPVAIAIAERDLRAALTTGRPERRARRRGRERQDALVGAEGLPAGRRPRPDHAHRPAGSPPRPADPRHGAADAARRPGRREGRRRPLAGANELNVEALPMEVPEHLEVDVSGMHIGDTLRLSSLDAACRRDAARRPRGDRPRDRHAADPRRGARARRGRRGRRGGRGRGAQRRGRGIRRAAAAGGDGESGTTEG